MAPRLRPKLTARLSRCERAQGSNPFPRSGGIRILQVDKTKSLLTPGSPPLASHLFLPAQLCTVLLGANLRCPSLGLADCRRPVPSRVPTSSCHRNDWCWTVRCQEWPAAEEERRRTISCA